MFSIFEKIRFILASKLRVRTQKKRDSKKNDNYWVRLLKRLLKIILTIVVLLFVFGLFLYNFAPPTISVAHSSSKRISTSESSYMMSGYLSSGRESQLRVNDKIIELVDNDFAFNVELKEGDNKLIFEASNDRGTTKEIYIINYTTRP